MGQWNHTNYNMESLIPPIPMTERIVCPYSSNLKFKTMNYWYNRTLLKKIGKLNKSRIYFDLHFYNGWGYPNTDLTLLVQLPIVKKIIFFFSCSLTPSQAIFTTLNIFRCVRLTPNDFEVTKGDILWTTTHVIYRV